MKKYAFAIPIMLLAIQASVSSCDSNKEAEARIAKAEKKYQDSIAVLKGALKEKQEQIELLSYPADQRLQKAKELIDAGELDKASSEISQLKRLFPNSQEASASTLLIGRINDLKEAKRQEEERIKALGFKAIAEQTSVKIDYNTVTLSGISVGSRFTFDSYGNEWYYRDADRGSKYVTMQMSVTSTSHAPLLPAFAIYSISGDKMEYEGSFDTRFARWKDYGAYLGNYHDSSNDFAKVSTVKFKLGLQVDNETLAKPYAIVLKKKNVLFSSYDRYANPPVSYTGSAGYPSTLSIKDFKNKYVIIKRYNLK